MICQTLTKRSNLFDTEPFRIIRTSANPNFHKSLCIPAINLLPQLLPIPERIQRIFRLRFLLNHSLFQNRSLTSFKEFHNLLERTSRHELIKIATYNQRWFSRMMAGREGVCDSVRMR